MDKRHWPWFLMTAAITIYGGSWVSSSAVLVPGKSAAEPVPAVVVQAVPSAIVRDADMAPASVRTAEAAFSSPETGGAMLAVLPAEPAATPYAFRLERLNGVSVSDDLKTVYEMKGQPKRIDTDPLLKHERLFIYDDCQIGLYDNFIQYIIAPGGAETIDIDGQRVTMELGALKQALGTPSLIAEDGIVYRKGQMALKLFVDPVSGKLTSVHLFSAMAN